MTPTHRIRRFAFAAAATLSVLFAGLALSGMAVASGGSEADVPESFTLAARHGGDRGEWLLTFPAPEANAEVDALSGSTTIGKAQAGSMEVESSMEASTGSHRETFEWLPEQAWRDGDGAWHAVHGLLSVDPDTGATVTVGDRTTFTPNWDVQWRETATGMWLGSTSLAGGGASASGGLWGSDESTSTFVFTAWDRVPACGLGDRLREGVDLAEAITVDGCGEAPMTFRATGVETLDGVQAVRFEATAEDHTLTFWYNPGIPEPLRVLRTDASGPWVEQTLVSFEAGSEPWSTGLALPKADEMPALEMAPRLPWGADDSGVQHPFPLSMAWRLAAEDLVYRDFAAFLAREPDAAAVNADYTEQREGSTTERVWSVLVLGEKDVFYLRATQQERYAAGEAGDLLGLPPTGPPIHTYSFATGSASISGITLEDLPDELPTVASALAYWQALLGSAEPGNAWGLAGCGCEGGGLQVRAGRDLFDRPMKPVTGPAKDATIVSSLLSLDARGRPIGLLEENATYTRTAGPLASGAGSGMQGRVEGTVGIASRPGGFVPLSMSAVPITGTAGASFLALLSGLLVWFWPALKGTPVLGMFSRVREDRVLAHPQRASILQRIEAAPGIHYQELLRLVGGGKGSLEHHLRKLESARAVRAVRGPYYTCYFPWSANAADRAAAPALKSDGARRVLAAVRSHPGITGQELATRTGLSASSVSEHVSRLAAAGLVQPARDGRTVRIQPAPAAKGLGAGLGLAHGSAA